jgi:hypothetical protein
VEASVFIDRIAPLLVFRWGEPILVVLGHQEACLLNRENDLRTGVGLFQCVQQDALELLR